MDTASPPPPAEYKNDGTVAHGSAILGFEVVIKTEPKKS